MDFLVIPSSVVAWFLGSALVVQLAVVAVIFISFVSLGWLLHKAYNSKSKNETGNFKEEAIGSAIPSKVKINPKASQNFIEQQSEAFTSPSGDRAFLQWPSIASALADLPVVKFDRNIMVDDSDYVQIRYYPLSKAQMGENAVVLGEDAQKRPFISYTYISDTGKPSFVTLFKFRNSLEDNNWGVIMNDKPLIENHSTINCYPLSEAHLRKLNTVLNAPQSIKKRL